ncbi:unnamed protein product [Heterosigma akashiwo]
MATSPNTGRSTPGGTARKDSAFRVPSFKEFFRRNSRAGTSENGGARTISLSDSGSFSVRQGSFDGEALRIEPALDMDKSRFKLLKMIPASHQGYMWRKGSVTSMWRQEPDFFQIKGTVLLQFRKKSGVTSMLSRDTVFSLHRTVELKNCSVEELDIRNHFAFKLRFILDDDEEKELALDCYSEEHRELWMDALNEASYSLKITDFLPAAKIGEGEWGNVFVVRKKDRVVRTADERHKLYAIKEIEMSRSSNVKHIIHERHVLGAVSLHPFVIGLHHSFRHGRYLYFCMDFAAGGDLFSRMKRAKPTRSEAVLYAAEVLLALEHLHTHDVVYRDLKPENVLLDADGHVQLADMGLAKVLHEGEKTLTFCGTESYIAPEIIARQHYRFSVDLWQFGCFVFELYCGRSPFWKPRHLRQNLHETISSGVYKTPSSVPSAARPLIAALLHVDPQKRLGCGAGTGWGDLKRDAYFEALDFEPLLANILVVSHTRRALTKQAAGQGRTWATSTSASRRCPRSSRARARCPARPPPRSSATSCWASTSSR